MKKLEFALLLMEKKDKWKRAEDRNLEEYLRTSVTAASLPSLHM